MPIQGKPLQKMGFVTIGFFDPDHPHPGHQDVLNIIQHAEELGFDSVWLRHRHLQYGISSPLTVLAAASQLTSRITLGTAVIPLGLENPFRLAEDLATVDILSEGRLNPGISIGPPIHYEYFKHALYPDSYDKEDFSKDRAQRLLDYISGAKVSEFAGTEGIEIFDNRIQPLAPGLRDRIWYGAASRGSAVWAAKNDVNLMVSSVVRNDSGASFADTQAAHIDAYRDNHRLGADARVSQGLVIIPTDSATAEQKAKYHAYTESRLERTTKVQAHGLMYAPDIIGSAEQIAEVLWNHPGFQRVNEVVWALPFTFAPEDYHQILEDMVNKVGPLLGWKPTN